MLMFQKVVIGDAERGLVYKNRRFDYVLSPGVYRLKSFINSLEVNVHNITGVEYTGKDVETLVARLGDRLGDTFMLADIGTKEVGLLLKNGKLEDVLAPGSRKLYWKGHVALEVQRVSLVEGIRWTKRDGRLRKMGAGTLCRCGECTDGIGGLLFVDASCRVQCSGCVRILEFPKNVSAE